MKGVIVGCDRNQEWLLSWWWENYSRHNSLPVSFIDFGMSDQALTWCGNKGTVIPYIDPPLELKEVDPKTKSLWQTYYGEGSWFFRLAWFKKAFAFRRSPYPLSLWIDLDCEVLGNLEPLFNSLMFGIDIAIKRESPSIQESNLKAGIVQPGEINYNSGVVAFRKEAQILDHWIKLVIDSNHLFMGDQNALSRAIFIHKPLLLELDPIYNWSFSDGPNPEALIHHYICGMGKLELLSKLGLYSS